MIKNSRQSKPDGYKLGDEIMIGRLEDWNGEALDLTTQYHTNRVWEFIKNKIAKRKQ